jgi:DNA-binding LacI/PurR family transcriptional regulator
MQLGHRRIAFIQVARRVRPSHASPPLTTVRQPPDYVGTITAETLNERLKGREKPARVHIKGLLIGRESTAPPRVTSLVEKKNNNQMSSFP